MHILLYKCFPIILKELGIVNAYKVYYVLINDYDGLSCHKDVIQMLNTFDNNNYDCLNLDYDKFINTLLSHEYNNDNVTNEIINIINREVI